MDSEVQRGMESIKSENQAGSALIQTLLFLAGDYVALVLAGVFSLFIRNELITRTVFHVSPAYLYLWVPLVFMAFIFYEGLYSWRYLTYEITKKLIFAPLGDIVFAVVLMFFTHIAGDVSRLFVFLYGVLAYMLLCIFRVIISRMMKKMSFFQTPVLIVGAGETADVIVNELEKDAGMRYRIVGFLEDNTPKTEYVKSHPILGGFADLEEVVKKTGVKSVLIAAPGLPQDQLSDLIFRAQSITESIGVVPNLVGVPMTNVSVESFFDQKVMVLRIKNNLALRSNQMIKRVLDIVLSIIGIIALSPVLIGIAIAVKMDSKGPAIYKSQRVGKNHKAIGVYKFRSMVVNADEVLQKVLAENPEARKEFNEYYKLKDDPRITKIGDFLRKTSLDELPQLINVIKGDMSLVGPRPITEQEVPLYEKYIDDYFMVRPGITGLWQVSGRSDVSYPERVQMDVWYVHNWEPWLDIVLLWRTVGIVVKGKGAY